jgi:hypothetical protein
MKDFLAAHGNKVKGVLSCFDRMLFRGYRPVTNGAEMAKLINRQNVDYRTLKAFLLNSAERVKQRAGQMAKQTGRPFRYLQQKIPMEQEARKIAEADQVKEGLVCIFSMLQPCRTFSFKFHRGNAWAKSARRKCLYLYLYFIDREIGLDTRQYSDLVSDGDAGLRQRTRMAGPKARPAPHRLHVGRQRVH